MTKIGEFIYPWGGGHYSRMMRLNERLAERLGEGAEIHLSSKGHVYEKLLGRFPAERVHEILMPTPIDGSYGPSVSKSLLNVLLPVSGNPPLVSQIADYLRAERRLYDREKFDLVINDGDMGSNILARNRGIPSLFVTNQFRPRLYGSRAYLYPSLAFVAKQIAKASRILVADSPPPHTMCEYNLNFTDAVSGKVSYVGHFAAAPAAGSAERTDLERLVDGCDFGYWMRTGNKSTNDGTGKRYEEAFRRDGMARERRIVTHARDDPGIESVLGEDKKRYSVSEALEKKVDWLQIDVGFVSDREKDTILGQCKYAVINGSHTVMGEIVGAKSKPIIGIPVYDEHTNNLRWAEERNLGILARNAVGAVAGIARIRENYEEFCGSLAEFSENFVSGGAENAARIAAEALEEKR